MARHPGSHPKSLPSPAKAAKMLKEGKVGGQALSSKQRKLFGLIASGKMPTRLQDMPKSARKNIRVT